MPAYRIVKLSFGLVLQRRVVSGFKVADSLGADFLTEGDPVAAASFQHCTSHFAVETIGTFNSVDVVNGKVYVLKGTLQNIEKQVGN